MSDANQNQDPHVLLTGEDALWEERRVRVDTAPHLPHSTGQGQAGGDKKKKKPDLAVGAHGFPLSSRRGFGAMP